MRTRAQQQRDQRGHRVRVSLFTVRCALVVLIAGESRRWLNAPIDRELRRVGWSP